jgi:flagellar protein FlbD
MIQLTRINKLPLVLNADLIEQIETTPDTVIQLINGQKLVVLESAEEVVRKVIEYRRKLISLPPETVPAKKTGAGPAAPGVPSESE